jgi:dihydroorotate dehydrogenase electron transfer subunit
MAVSAFNAYSFSFIYEIVGAGTKKLGQKTKGEIINILINLGNQFTYQSKNGKPLLVAGGAGLGPILCLAN